MQLFSIEIIAEKAVLHLVTHHLHKNSFHCFSLQPPAWHTLFSFNCVFFFLNDLFGGSPYNAACRLVIANEAYGIVTGVNLPMLIEMCSAQMMDEGLSIQELMEKAAEAGKSGMQFFHASQIADDDEEEDDL